MKPRVPRHITAFAQKMRRELTPEEQLLWKYLRLGQFAGQRFRRQHPIPPYIADFACLKSRLVIELDGGQHGGPDDTHRDACLIRQGWRVLRFSNQQLKADLNYVLEQIACTLAEVVPSPNLPLVEEET